MRKFYTSLLLSAFVATAANATNPVYVDDLERHATFVGQMRVNHTVQPGQIIPEGTYIHYDSRLPADMQLVPRVGGRMMEYTCPAVPGIPGLTDPRRMGECPEFHIARNATRVEVLRAAYDNQDMQPLPGFYRSLGIIRIASAIQNGSRVNTLRMICRSGVEDGLPLTIDFRESYHELVNSWDVSQAQYDDRHRTRVVQNPQGANLPQCFTFSCWYRSTGSTPQIIHNALFELRNTATEANVVGQCKILSFCVSHADSLTANGIKLWAGILGSRDNVRQERVKTGTKQVQIAAAIQEQFIMETKPTGEFTVKDVLVCLDKEQKKHYWKNRDHGPVWLNGYEVVLIGGDKYGSFFYRTKTPKTVQVKKVTQAAKPAQFKTEDVFENRTVHELKPHCYSEGLVPEHGWMNFVLHVNPATRSCTMFHNGVQIQQLTTDYAVSLNTPHQWTIGARHAAQMAEIHLIQGQLVPVSAFCARNSQNEIVPVKYEGELGPDGWQRRFL